MSIWLNVYAIVILLVFGGVTFLLNFISPDFKDASHPFFWLSFVVISGLFEKLGIRGRIFRVPIWVFGLIAYLATARSHYLESGSLIGLYSLFFVIVVGLFIGNWANKLRWEKAGKSLQELKYISGKGVAAASLFKNLRGAFFIPNYLNPDNYFQNLLFGKIYDIKYKKWFAKPNVNLHYMEFFEIVKKLVQEDEFKKYAVLMQASIQNIGSKKVFTIDYSMVESVLFLLEKKEKEFEIQLKKVKEARGKSRSNFS